MILTVTVTLALTLTWSLFFFYCCVLCQLPNCQMFSSHCQLFKSLVKRHICCCSKDHWRTWITLFNSFINWVSWTCDNMTVQFFFFFFFYSTTSVEFAHWRCIYTVQRQFSKIVYNLFVSLNHHLMLFLSLQSSRKNKQTKEQTLKNRAFSGFCMSIFYLCCFVGSWKNRTKCYRKTNRKHQLFVLFL